MYSRKSLGPRMEPWGIPALTGYSWEHFPSRSTRSCLLLKKEKIRPNISPEISWDLSLWRRPACQTLSKVLDISSTTAQVAPDLLKTPAILSDTTVRRSAVHWEDLKPHWKSEERTSEDLSPTFLNTGTINEKPSKNLENKTPSDIYWRNFRLTVL